MRLIRALSLAKIPARTCDLYFLPAPKLVRSQSPTQECGQCHLSLPDAWNSASLIHQPDKFSGHLINPEFLMHGPPAPLAYFTSTL